MIKRFAMATALFLAGSVASAHVPNIFVAGQPAKAQEINENFEHLLSEHSNYGVGGSTGGADVGVTTAGTDAGGTTAGTDAGGTTDGPTTGGTTTGGADPSGLDNQFYYAYVEGGVLKSADQPIEDSRSPDESIKLVDANDIVLRFITYGSLDLPQNFVVFDYDIEPTQSRPQNTSYFGEHVVIQFTAAADGSIDYSPASFIKRDSYSSGTLYYESADCTGQGYLDASQLRALGTVYNLDGEWFRLPPYDYSETNGGITAKSKTSEDTAAAIANPISDGCYATNELVNQAVIPIAYDPEPIRLKLKAPVRVVEP